MNPEEVIASEEARLGRRLNPDEKRAIRGGATSADGITATSLAVEDPRERTARAARESAVERDRAMADAPEEGGISDWLSNLPSHLREAAPSLNEWVGPSAGLGAAFLGEAADADDAELRSRARSMGHGAAEGATLGFADELAGAASAATGGDYTTSRDELRRAMAASREANPTLYGASGLVAGAAVPIPGLGGATGAGTRAASAVVPRVVGAVGRAARAGAAGGAIAGAGMSDAELTSDAAGLLRDTGEGAALGAGTGAVIGAGAEGAREVARAAPAIRTRADRAVLAVPSRSSAGGDRLLRDMAGPNPSAEARSEAAETVRGVVRRAGWFPSSDDIVRATDEALADGGPSRPFEERLAGESIDREELAAMLRRRAAAAERSPADASAMAPLRDVADRTFAGRPAPAPVAAPRAPVAALPAPAGPPTVRGAGRPTRLPGAATAPRLPAPEAAPRGVRATEPDLGALDRRRASPLRAEGPEATRAYEAPLPPPEMGEGTIPPGLGISDPADEAATLARLAEHRANPPPARRGRAPEVVTAPRAGGARPRARPVPGPGELGVDDLRNDILARGGPAEAATAPVAAPRATPPASGRTLHGTGTPAAGGPYRTPEPAAPLVRPRAERPAGARFYEGPGPAAAAPAAPPTRPRSPTEMPIYHRPEGGGRMRSAPGSALYEMRAWRERGFPVPGARRGPAEHGWRGAGSDLRSRIDEAYRARHGTEGPEGLDAYRAARRVEEAEIPIRRSAEAGAARDAGRSLIPLRNIMAARMASAAGAPPGVDMLVGSAAGAVDTVRGAAIRERMLDGIARRLEGPTGRALAAGDGSGVRATSGLMGRLGAGTAGREEPPAPDLRSRLADRRREAEPEIDAFTTGPAPDAPPTGTPPASSPVPPPAGGALPTPTRRGSSGGTLRSRLAGRRRR